MSPWEGTHAGALCLIKVTQKHIIPQVPPLGSSLSFQRPGHAPVSGVQIKILHVYHSSHPCSCLSPLLKIRFEKEAIN